VAVHGDGDDRVTVLLDRPQPDYYKRDESGAILLGRDGRPEFLPPFHDRPPEMAGMARTLGTWVNPDVDHERFLFDAPAHIRASLDRAKMLAGPLEPRAASGWQASISRLDGDGTAITGVTTEQLLVPDYTVPGGFIYGGKQIKYVLWGRQSSVITTPGTFTIRLRWGGIAAHGAHHVEGAAAAYGVGGDERGVSDRNARDVAPRRSGCGRDRDGDVRAVGRVGCGR
jgi:hypothetical protein